MRYEVIVADRVMGDTRTKADALRYADELVNAPNPKGLRVSIWDRTSRHWITNDHKRDREEK